MALVAITVGGAGLWYVRSLPRPVEVRADAASPAAGASATSSPDVIPILVDVAGWFASRGSTSSTTAIGSSTPSMLRAGPGGGLPSMR